ncbi:SDR family NAD(P)-dependent oxidoreductase, partial [Escherichia coli]
GKALAETVIQSGDFVIGTFRNQTQSDAFNNQYKDKAFALTLDITNPHEIKNTIQLVSDKFSRVDMLVNNAGFGLAGAIEEASIAEVREIFETN